MQLAIEDIKAFQKLWKESYGEDISEEKALEEATILLILMRTAYKPVSIECSGVTNFQQNLL